jgi:TRAP-type C4-dicarboxylate transport system permease large subunit
LSLKGTIGIHGPDRAKGALSYATQLLSTNQPIPAPRCIPAIVLFGPLLFPIAKQVGVHEVHYAMVVILAMGIGLFAPPFGVGYYAACAISRIHPDEGMKPIVGYMLALLIGTIIVAAVPWISIGFL